LLDCFAGAPDGVVSITLYSGSNLAGDSWFLSSQTGTHFSGSTDFTDNVVSSVKIVGGSVTLYEQPQTSTTGWTVTLGPGTYNASSGTGFMDNALSYIVLDCPVAGW
jgi:hypothetical protein